MICRGKTTFRSSRTIHPTCTKIHRKLIPKTTANESEIMAPIRATMQGFPKRWKTRRQSAVLKNACRFVPMKKNHHRFCCRVEGRSSPDAMRWQKQLHSVADQPWWWNPTRSIWSCAAISWTLLMYFIFLRSPITAGKFWRHSGTQETKSNKRNETNSAVGYGFPGREDDLPHNHPTISNFFGTKGWSLLSCKNKRNSVGCATRSTGDLSILPATAVPAGSPIPSGSRMCTLQMERSGSCPNLSHAVRPKGPERMGSARDYYRWGLLFKIPKARRHRDQWTVVDGAFTFGVLPRRFHDIWRLRRFYIFHAAHPVFGTAGWGSFLGHWSRNACCDF